MHRNIETLSCNHLYCGKARSITYAEGVFVALGIQHEMCLLHIFVCGLSGCTILFHFVPQTAQFSKKKGLLNVMYVFCLCNFVWNISHSKKTWATYDHKCILDSCKTRIILVKLKETRFFSPDLQQMLNIKFNKNPSSVCRVVSCGRTDRHAWRSY
jgi:hypothetical protein